MLSDKQLEKIEKILGHEIMEELEDAGDFDSTIAIASGAIKKAQDELEANPKYQELKSALKDIRAGLQEVKKYQNAKIQFCLHLIEESKA